MTENPTVILRPETEHDVDRIDAVTREAFKGQPLSDGSEPGIVMSLRRAGALTLSLVAELGGDVVGHVAFSPVTISDGSSDWYGLGPVSVDPAWQGKGIGSTLIWAGLQRLEQLGGRGCVLVGDPVYYKRFGFAADSRLVYEGVPAEHFLVRPTPDEAVPTGTVTYHPAFGGDAGR